MNIIRKIKLNQLGYYQFTDDEKKLITFLNENFLNLKKIQFPYYYASIFYFKEDKCIFQYNLIDKCVWIPNYIEFNFYNCSKFELYDMKPFLTYKYDIDIQFIGGHSNFYYEQIEEYYYKNKF